MYQEFLKYFSKTLQMFLLAGMIFLRFSKKLVKSVEYQIIIGLFYDENVRIRENLPYLKFQTPNKHISTPIIKVKEFPSPSDTQTIVLMGTKIL